MTDLNFRFQKHAVFRVGEVTEIKGQRITVSVDRDKNLTELFYYGRLIKNVGVGSYIDIRNGYMSLIGKVDGENTRADINEVFANNKVIKSKRALSISLVGYIDSSGKFFSGTKELPLIGNEVYLLTREKVHQFFHYLDSKDSIYLNIAMSEYEGFKIRLPVDGLMNSHIAIFGNTGSGKSNTLATLYQNFIKSMRKRNRELFEKHSRIIIFDFNGEYSDKYCLSSKKYTYQLSTENNNGNKIPLPYDGLFDIETLSTLADATDKTQRHFLKKATGLANSILTEEKDNGLNHLQYIMRQQVKKIFKLDDKTRIPFLVDYFRIILPDKNNAGAEIPIDYKLVWHSKTSQYIYSGEGIEEYINDKDEIIEKTEIYRRIDCFKFNNDYISNFIIFCYIQLIIDVLINHTQNEHIPPAIDKLVSRQSDIQKVFSSCDKGDIFKRNVIVLNLNNVNIEMKKMLPLLICKRIYQEQKDRDVHSTLNIVIDEAHNILSYESLRDVESRKNYRLETYEEIIKEGGKFGVFMTISSQRPSDISQTITSHADNYFIHRLINQKDLQSISSSVSYIDKITEESIPTLPTGTCIFCGVAGQIPLKLSINQLTKKQQPKSTTRKFSDLIPKKIRKNKPLNHIKLKDT